MFSLASFAFAYAANSPSVFGGRSLRVTSTSGVSATSPTGEKSVAGS
jgi:hypothetical protein